MKTKLLSALVLSLSLCAGLLTPHAAQAQYNYSLNYQTNTINVASNWVGNGTYVVGSNTYWNALNIQNGGALSNGTAFIGLLAGGSNNSVRVSGTGSVWSNQFTLFVGYDGAGNRLAISNGGAVFNLPAYMGYSISSSNNVAVVTGTGSVWSNRGNLYIGTYGASNQLVVSNGGAVFDGVGTVGFASNGNNSVRISGTGSVWSNRNDLYVGNFGSGNQLVVSNGGAVFNGFGYLGYNNSSSNNNVQVSGFGSVWSNNILYVGYAGAANQLRIADGGAVYDSFGYLGSGGSSASSNTVIVSGSGSIWSNSTSLALGFWNKFTRTFSLGNKLVVTNGGAVHTGSGQMVINAGTLILDGGTVTTRFLFLKTSESFVKFNSGFLSSGQTGTNNLPFIVGDAVNVATFHLAGGVHSFGGLRIRSNSFLTGCGTINGTVVVDAGGTVIADCGGSLTFNGSVTNNGTMRAINSSVLEAYGPVINNGLIDITGGTTNFHSTFVNNGSIVSGASVLFQVTSIVRQGNDLRITWRTSAGKTNELQATAGGAGGNYSTNNFAAIFSVTNTVGTTTNYLDIGGATNVPAFYYRVRLVP